MIAQGNTPRIKSMGLADVGRWEFAADGSVISNKQVFSLGDFDPELAREPVISIHNVEIFRCGTFNGGPTWSPDDLDLMVQSFGEIRCPVTIGHDEEGQAYGWIESVWTEDQSLWANLIDVPVSFALAIYHGRYTERSIELIFKRGGDTKEPFIRAVTFLGAASPAVSLMEPIDKDELKESIDDALAVATFSHKEIDGERMSVSWGKPIKFKMFPSSDPFPGSHGPVGGGRDKWTSTDLDHWHIATLDDDMNGFTSFELMDDGFGNIITKEGTAIHQVSKGKVVVADDDQPHTHTISDFITLSKKFSSEKETGTMAPEEKKNEEAQVNGDKDATVVPVVSQEAKAEMAKMSADFDDKISKQSTIIKEQGEVIAKMQAAEADADDEKQFASIWSKGLSKGSVVPASRESEFSMFKSLPRDEDIATSLAEGQKTPRELYGDNIMARPAIVPMGTTALPQRDIRRPDDKHNFALQADAKAYMKDEGWGMDRYPEAVRICARKIATG